MLKFPFLIGSFIFLFLGCASNEKKEYKKPLQSMDQSTRHGWTVFSGPKRTLMDVNDKSSISRGQGLYQKHCASCHGKSGMGDGPLAKKNQLRPANLSNMAKTFPNYYLVFQVNRGKGEMPKWEDVLSNQEVWDLSNYIQSLKP